MSIKINLKKSINDNAIKNYALFTDQEFKVNSLNKLRLSKFTNEINKTINSNKSPNKDFLVFNLNSHQKIILIKLKKNITSLNNEKVGANFYDYIKKNSIVSSTFLEKNIHELVKQNKNSFEEFLHGAELKSYEFNKYKTKNNTKTYEICVLTKSKIIPGFQVPYSEKIKKDAEISSMAVGAIINANQANDIIANNRADLVAMGRELLADTQWVYKAANHFNLENAKDYLPDSYSFYLSRRDEFLDRTAKPA